MHITTHQCTAAELPAIPQEVVTLAAPHRELQAGELLKRVASYALYVDKLYKQLRTVESASGRVAELQRLRASALSLLDEQLQVAPPWLQVRAKPPQRKVLLGRQPTVPLTLTSRPPASVRLAVFEKRVSDLLGDKHPDKQQAVDTTQQPGEALPEPASAASKGPVLTQVTAATPGQEGLPKEQTLPACTSGNKASANPTQPALRPSPFFFCQREQELVTSRYDTRSGALTDLHSPHQDSQASTPSLAAGSTPRVLTQSSTLSQRPSLPRAPSYRERVAAAENARLEAEISAIQEDSLGEEECSTSGASAGAPEEEVDPCLSLAQSGQHSQADMEPTATLSPAKGSNGSSDPSIYAASTRLSDHRPPPIACPTSPPSPVPAPAGEVVNVAPMVAVPAAAPRQSTTESDRSDQSRSKVVTGNGGPPLLYAAKGPQSSDAYGMATAGRDQIGPLQRAMSRSTRSRNTAELLPCPANGNRQQPPHGASNVDCHPTSTAIQRQGPGTNSDGGMAPLPSAQPNLRVDMPTGQLGLHGSDNSYWASSSAASTSAMPSRRPSGEPTGSGPGLAAPAQQWQQPSLGLMQDLPDQQGPLAKGMARMRSARSVGGLQAGPSVQQAAYHSAPGAPPAAARPAEVPWPPGAAINPAAGMAQPPSLSQGAVQGVPQQGPSYPAGQGQGMSSMGGADKDEPLPVACFSSCSSQASQPTDNPRPRGLKKRPVMPAFLKEALRQSGSQGTRSSQSSDAGSDTGTTVASAAMMGPGAAAHLARIEEEAGRPATRSPSPLPAMHAHGHVDGVVQVARGADVRHDGAGAKAPGHQMLDTHGSSVSSNSTVQGDDLARGHGIHAGGIPHRGSATQPEPAMWEEQSPPAVYYMQHMPESAPGADLNRGSVAQAPSSQALAQGSQVYASPEQVSWGPVSRGVGGSVSNSPMLQHTQEPVNVPGNRMGQEEGKSAGDRRRASNDGSHSSSNSGITCVSKTPEPSSRQPSVARDMQAAANSVAPTATLPQHTSEGISSASQQEKSVKPSDGAITAHAQSQYQQASNEQGGEMEKSFDFNHHNTTQQRGGADGIAAAVDQNASVADRAKWFAQQQQSQGRPVVHASAQAIQPAPGQMAMPGEHQGGLSQQTAPHPAANMMMHGDSHAGFNNSHAMGQSAMQQGVTHVPGAAQPFASHGAAPALPATLNQVYPPHQAANTSNGGVPGTLSHVYHPHQPSAVNGGEAAQSAAGEQPRPAHPAPSASVASYSPSGSVSGHVPQHGGVWQNGAQHSHGMVGYGQGHGLPQHGQAMSGYAQGMAPMQHPDMTGYAGQPQPMHGNHPRPSHDDSAYGEGAGRPTRGEIQHHNQQQLQPSWQDQQQYRTDQPYQQQYQQQYRTDQAQYRQDQAHQYRPDHHHQQAQPSGRRSDSPADGPGGYRNISPTTGRPVSIPGISAATLERSLSHTRPAGTQGFTSVERAQSALPGGPLSRNPSPEQWGQMPPNHPHQASAGEAPGYGGPPHQAQAVAQGLPVAYAASATPPGPWGPHAMHPPANGLQGYSAPGSRGEQAPMGHHPEQQQMRPPQSQGWAPPGVNMESIRRRSASPPGLNVPVNGMHAAPHMGARPSNLGPGRAAAVVQGKLQGAGMAGPAQHSDARAPVGSHPPPLGEAGLEASLEGMLLNARPAMHTQQQVPYRQQHEVGVGSHPVPSGIPGISSGGPRHLSPGQSPRRGMQQQQLGQEQSTVHQHVLHLQAQQQLVMRQTQGHFVGEQNVSVAAEEAGQRQVKREQRVQEPSHAAPPAVPGVVSEAGAGLHPVRSTPVPAAPTSALPPRSGAPPPPPPPPIPGVGPKKSVSVAGNGPPPPPPPGPPPPPPPMMSAKPVIVKPGAPTDGSASSVASSISIPSVGAYNSLVDSIRALGASGAHRGHLRSLSKSKAKRGHKGEAGLQDSQGALIAAGAGSSSDASTVHSSASYGMLSGREVAGAQNRGSLQALQFMQRLRDAMRPQQVQEEEEEEDDSDDGWT